MKSDRYIIRASKSLKKYKFYSEGPKGRVIKRIVYEQFERDSHVYNLAFGDLNADGDLDDIVVTDNDDTRKVLSTVAWTIRKFLQTYSGTSVYIEGSTKARTRLYRIAISNNLNSLKDEFEILGLTGSGWHRFDHNIDYRAFLVHLKNDNFVL
jgi:hypothetical protein